mmetsp:Transcript_21934/g.36238  ORF Transcript_21934/g.36238 Transcript_21934/m.36238 type:complete len:142 (+) Transcript_21934:28-453(+)
MAATKNWDKCVGMVVGQGRILSGAAILPILPEDPGVRKSVIYAQKGVSLRVPEATALVDAVMLGRVHRDYVYAGGHQYLITTVMESAYYGRCTSTATAGGIVLVKTDKLLVLATYTEPITAAEAIPYVHQKASLFNNREPT